MVTVPSRSFGDGHTGWGIWGFRGKNTTCNVWRKIPNTCHSTSHKPNDERKEKRRENHLQPQLPNRSQRKQRPTRARGKGGSTALILTPPPQRPQGANLYLCVSNRKPTIPARFKYCYSAVTCDRWSGKGFRRFCVVSGKINPQEKNVGSKVAAREPSRLWFICLNMHQHTSNFTRQKRWKTHLTSPKVMAK